MDRSPQAQDSGVIKCCEQAALPTKTGFLAVLCLLQGAKQHSAQREDALRWGRYAWVFHAKSVCMARRKPRKSSQRVYSLLLVHPHGCNPDWDFYTEQNLLGPKTSEAAMSKAKSPQVLRPFLMHYPIVEG